MDVLPPIMGNTVGPALAIGDDLSLASLAGSACATLCITYPRLRELRALSGYSGTDTHVLAQGRHAARELTFLIRAG